MFVLVLILSYQDVSIMMLSQYSGADQSCVMDFDEVFAAQSLRLIAPSVLENSVQRIYTGTLNHCG